MFARNLTIATPPRRGWGVVNLTQVPHLLVGCPEPAEKLDHFPLEGLERVIIRVVGDLAPQVRPQLLDGIEAGGIRGQVDALEAPALLYRELLHALSTMGGGVIGNDVQGHL